MITAEMVENPVLEELEDSVPLIDDVGRTRGRARPRAAAARKRTRSPPPKRKTRSKKSILVRSSRNTSIPAIAARARWKTSSALRLRISCPSPATSDRPPDLAVGRASRSARAVREAAKLIIGNLNEDGYLIASDDELMGVAPPAAPEVDAAPAENVVQGSGGAGTGCSG